MCMLVFVCVYVCCLCLPVFALGDLYCPCMHVSFCVWRRLYLHECVCMFVSLLVCVCMGLYVFACVWQCMFAHACVSLFF